MTNAPDIEIKREIDATRNSESFNAYAGGDLVLSAVRYNGSRFASVWWVADEEQEGEHFNRLLKFYQDLGGQTFDAKPNESQGIVFQSTAGIEEEDLPLEYLADNAAQLRSHPHFPRPEDLLFLRVDGPYMAFSIEGGPKGEGARERNLVIGTHVDLSEQVSKLMAETARHPVQATALQPLLSEIYSFN